MNPFNLNPLKVVNYYAYPRRSEHYGKIKILLNYNDGFKRGEWIDIDTEDFKVRGEVVKVYDKILIVRMDQIAHKGTN